MAALTKGISRAIRSSAGGGRYIKAKPKVGGRIWRGSVLSLEDSTGLAIKAANGANTRPLGVYTGPDLDLRNVTQANAPEIVVFVGQVFIEDTNAAQASAGLVHFTTDNDLNTGKGAGVLGVQCFDIVVSVGLWVDFNQQSAA